MSSTGAYGTTIPSKIRNSDIDIFYAYHETRTSDSVDNAVFKKLPSSILTDVLYDSDGESIDNVLEGLYNLKLPLEYFNRKGFYTVYINPKEIPAVIADVSDSFITSASAAINDCIMSNYISDINEAISDYINNKSLNNETELQNKENPLRGNSGESKGGICCRKHKPRVAIKPLGYKEVIGRG